MTDYNSYKSWPFNEAKKIVKRFGENNTKEKIIFETGYGPSGLPHIGTFGEVLRTNMVRFCYEKLTGKQTDLIAFSDDMDGFRKVPDNIPNKEKFRSQVKIISSSGRRRPRSTGRHRSRSRHPRR